MIAAVRLVEQERRGLEQFLKRVNEADSLFGCPIPRASLLSSQLLLVHLVASQEMLAAVISFSFNRNR